MKKKGNWILKNDCSLLMFRKILLITYRILERDTKFQKIIRKTKNQNLKQICTQKKENSEGEDWTKGPE